MSYISKSPLAAYPISETLQCLLKPLKRHMTTKRHIMV